MFLKLLFCCFVFVCVILKTANCTEIEDDVQIFTVATEENDGYRRYIRSAKHHGIPINTLGMGVRWNGGDMLGTGGGQKINMLRAAIEQIPNKNNTIILFTDSYDVVFTSGIEEIIQKFKTTGAKILFGAEHFCWPDDSLKDKYPIVSVNGVRFLNSGMFIGYAQQLYELIDSSISDSADDQLFYTNLFLNEETRNKYKIQLDTKSEIFQNLHGAADDIKLDVSSTTGEGSLHNVHFHSTPNVIHGNGLSKIVLNSIANYLGTFKDKHCVICEEDNLILDESNLPVVSVAILIEKPVPFFEEFLEKILTMNYPKENINIFIHCITAFHDKLVQNFIDKFGKQYKSIKSILSKDEIDERRARQLAVSQAELKESNYLFVIDNDVHINNPNTLRELLKYNKSFVAPVIAKRSGFWSNFWGALSDTKYYARSHDYVDIVKKDILGIWNVPFVSLCYLVKRNVFPVMNFDDIQYDPDMALCDSLRNNGVFMNIVNLNEYGHLIDTDEFNINAARPDFYTLLTNPVDWEKRYIHPKYAELLTPGYNFSQPCPDVYWFPIGTEQFCDDMVAIMEHFGKWSGGKNQDERLQGGYEAVPTRDIHMNQVGLEAIWLRFLKEYVRPLQEAVFTGYYHNPPKSLMNFVVRYKPDEQPSLRPHHDSSTYTINIALNRANSDYSGGGCKFLRYNCSVTDTKKGWMLMHPGRLTHFHEGLKVTNGTRYIMISFIDP